MNSKPTNQPPEGRDDAPQWIYDYDFLQKLTEKVNGIENGEGIDMEGVEAVLVAINYPKATPPASVVNPSGLQDESIDFKLAREAVQTEIKTSKEYEKYCKSLETLWRDIDFIVDCDDLPDRVRLADIKNKIQLFNKQIKL